jgi:predicted regulator of Ras-like GTPase activity (Roadblock/LC7/MglB family)
MSDHYTDALATGPASRSGRLDQVLATLLRQAPDVQAAAVVSFDGLPMAAMLPPGMDEDRVAAMSAALLSLGERAAEGLGRGALSQVYVEGEHGTVFLVSADDEAVLVAVGAEGAKVGMLLFEVRRAAAAVADTLRPVPAPAVPVVAPQPPVQPVPVQHLPAPHPVERGHHRAEPPVTVVAATAPDAVSAQAAAEPPPVPQPQPQQEQQEQRPEPQPVPQLAPPPRVDERRDWNGHGAEQEQRRPSATW